MHRHIFILVAVYLSKMTATMVGPRILEERMSNYSGVLFGAIYIEIALDLR